MYCVVLAMVYSCVCVSACVNYYLCGYVPYVVPMYVGMCGVCVYGIITTCGDIMDWNNMCHNYVCLQL